jgi:N-dimethylarginine dimethylaminohydrolase
MARLMARSGRRPLSNREIAKTAKMTVEKVAWISRKKGWVGIEVFECEAFLKGCGVVNLGTAIRYWNHTMMTAQKPLAHLSKLPYMHAYRLAKVVVK